MKVLALDTATLEASVAICDDLKPLAQVHRKVTTHSDHLLALVDDTLRAASLDIGAIDAVVCGAGPGSFTGVRIGLATAKGLCFALGKPLVMASSLGALGSLGGRGRHPDALTLVVVDARRDEVFAGLFQGAKPVGEEVVCAPEDLLQAIDLTAYQGAELLLIGCGALRYETLMRALLPDAQFANDHRIRAADLLPEGLVRLEAGDFADLESAVPNYLRGPDIRAPKTPA
jgi:tRNA threonylcarbamoyladenosine biosynthesis protein TsaB